MKKNANQLHDELTKKLITENYVDLQPINKMEPTEKEGWESKFFNYINEAGEKSLNPIVNNDMKVNTKEEEEKIKAEEKKVAKEVENIASRNYDYSPKVDNINNVNAQEMMNGVYCEIKNNPELSLEEAQAKVIKNLAKDSLHYVKEGQFGVEGLGYSEQKIEENDGETYGGSGYSEKLKEGDSEMQPVKESINSKVDKVLKEHFQGISTTGNPHSFAAMSAEVINKMLEENGLNEKPNSLDLFMEENKEQDLPMDEAKAEDDVDEARQTAIEASQEAAGMDIDEKKDHDGDGDIDSDDYMAARDKAIKANMKKKPKKESIDTKLAEIGKEAEAVKLEAQLDYLYEFIQEKVDRVNSINEDENLKELIDKVKMKQMQKEIKLLEKKKAKMEKLYEKSCGKKYSKKEMVDETEEVDESFDSVVDKIMDQGKSREDAEKIAGAINRDHVGNYKD